VLNLKAVRENNKFSQQKLADLLHVSRSTIAMWETGKSEPNLSHLEKLSDILSISVDELLGKTNEVCSINEIPDFELNNRNEKYIDKYLNIDEHAKKIVNSILDIEYDRCNSSTVKKIKPERQKLIKISSFRHKKGPHSLTYLRGKLSAGPGNMVFAEDPRTVQLPEEIEVPYRANVIVEIDGKSMEPYIHDGYMAYIEETPFLNHGEIGYFIVNGEKYIKKLIVDTNDDGYRNITLYSINRIFRDIRIGLDDRFVVVGRYRGQVPKEDVAEYLDV